MRTARRSRVRYCSIATLRYGGGEHGVLAPLCLEDRIAVLAAVAPALGGRGQFKAAVAAYAEAVSLADGPLPAGSPAFRALAVGGNNLAMALEQKADRDPGETAGMLDAAAGGSTNSGSLRAHGSKRHAPNTG